jgi:pyruvate/2-oxoglutarate dehydrogenase complex dihydrolipoamide dehydrogenase (E3) component
VVATLPAGAIPKARLLNETDGLLKLLVEKSSGKILGCTLFCADSHEMINFVSAAMKLGADYTFLRDFIFTHPTMSESLNDLAKKIKL